MYRLLALLRLIHRELYLLGPGIVFAVLSKYRVQCSWLIVLLCAATAVFDLIRWRWLGGLLWTAAAAVLFAGFESDARLWGTSTTIALGWTAIVLAVGAMLNAFAQELRVSLALARRERHALRRVQPGAPSRPERSDVRPAHGTRRYGERD